MMKQTKVVHFANDIEPIHLYSRKMDAVRRAGMLGSTVIVCSFKKWFRQRERARALKKQYKFTRVPKLKSNSKWTDYVFAVCLLCVYLPRKHVVFYLLKVPTGRFFLAAKLANTYFRRKWLCILELEGDMSAQSEYRGLDYSAEELQSEIEMVDQADGLVLMSDAHIRLWEERLNRKLDALPCPPIVSGNFRYSRKERERIRQEEGWVDKMVLVYCGSVSWAWQNFQSVCAIVAGLRDFADARLLVLTGEQEIAQSEIDKHGISDISTIKYVSGDEVPSYLSAADTGFFLRDDHLMCRIVTSAKLGEYLACGLPVISTDIASLYPEFSIRNGFSIRIDPESKEMTPDSIAKLNDLVACHQKNDSDRQRVSDLFHEEFSDQKIGDSYASYVSKLVRESNEQT